MQPIAAKPLGVIDLLDGAFAALRQRARVIVAIVAGLVVPVSIFQGWISRDDLGGANLNDFLNDPTIAQEVSDPAAAYDLAFFVGQGLGLLTTAIAGVAVSHVVYGWFEGRDVTISEAITFTVRRMGAIVGAFVVIHVIEGLGFIAVIIPGLIVIVLSSLTSPVLAVETQLGPVEAMRRSWELVRRRSGPIVGLIVLLGTVGYAVSQAVGTLPEFVALVVGPDRAWPLVAVANLLTSIILIPVTGAAMCLAYLDIRFRTEGLDLQRRIEIEFPAVEAVPEP